MVYLENVPCMFGKGPLHVPIRSCLLLVLLVLCTLTHLLSAGPVCYYQEDFEVSINPRLFLPLALQASASHIWRYLLAAST
jgi:hypothetical protein